MGFEPKKTIADAVKDVAAALLDNRIANPDSEQYYNVKTMKKVLQV